MASNTPYRDIITNKMNDSTKQTEKAWIETKYCMERAPFDKLTSTDGNDKHSSDLKGKKTL